MMGQPILIEHSHTDVLDWPWDRVVSGSYGPVGWICQYCNVLIRAAFPPHYYVWRGDFTTRCYCGNAQDDPCHVVIYPTNEFGGLSMNPALRVVDVLSDPRLRRLFQGYGPMTWRRFSWMTRLVRPPKGMQRAVEQCPLPFAGDRDCSASISTVDRLASSVPGGG